MLVKPCLEHKYVLWHIRLLSPYGLKQLISIFELEWRVTCNHLVDEATKTPPVNTLVMALPVDDFWCQVLRSSTNRLSQLVVFDDFGQSKVS